MSVKIKDLIINERYSFNVTATLAGNPTQYKDAKLLSVMNNAVANQITDTNTLLNRLTNINTAGALSTVLPEEANYYMFEVDTTDTGMVLVPSYVIEESSLIQSTSTTYKLSLTITDPSEIAAVKSYLDSNQIQFTLIRGE